MGTRGYLAYRFRGRYYVLYNQLDSDPGGLGSDIVGNIPSDPEEYREWFENLHKQLSKWEHALLTKVLAIPESVIKLLKVGSGRLGHLEPRFEAYLDERMTGTPSYEAPTNNLFMEWVYIVDLDNDLFIVDNGALATLIFCVPKLAA